ncbi:unnamed protein product [Phytophthora lilii]|uniref:Unnamed protein product n=1 Tax=Phytophthora lilii TaxID=2077276 RepID=A0A9W6WQA9_9STRA|nr:unnamed protein product [Phytophthora lilii]
MKWMDTFISLLKGLEDAYRTASNVQGPASKDELKMIDNVNENLTIIREVIFSDAMDIKGQSYEQYDQDEEDPLHTLHDESEASYQKYGEAMKRYEAAKEAVKGNNSKAARSALKAADAAVKATKAVFKAKAKSIRI